MRKRPRLTPPKGLLTNYNPHDLLSGDEFDPEDYASALPDDILISILSRLTLKEAAVTSNVSSRWRYLWAHISGLDLSADDTLDRIAGDPKLRTTERPKYINWANRIVRQHRAEILDSVRICFDLDKSSKSAIDNWVKFAVSKGVQRLELDLLENGETLRQPTRNYSFPYKQLLRNVQSFARMKCLKALSLKCVNVCEEALDCILSKCPVLRFLSIHGSGDLARVRITGGSLALRYLEIVFCMGIEKVEISNTNLVSFSYLGPGIDLIMNNVPMLDEISIGEGYSGLENNVFGQLSCCLNHLEVLTLDIYRPEDEIEVSKFPELPNLKQLILTVGAWEDDSLLEFTELIKACPNLNRFVLQLIWMAPEKRRRTIRRVARFPLKSLKLVEILGYYGRTSEVEFVMYLMENAKFLQKIIIDPRSQILGRSPVVIGQIKKEESARKSAKRQLQPKKPPGIQLVIL